MLGIPPPLIQTELRFRRREPRLFFALLLVCFWFWFGRDAIVDAAPGQWVNRSERPGARSHGLIADSRHMLVRIARIAGAERRCLRHSLRADRYAEEAHHHGFHLDHHVQFRLGFAS
jgi:hypothetical protein